MTTKLFSSVAGSRNPGDVLDTSSVSTSTLRRWEKKGWIADKGSSRLSWVVLTVDGYRVA